MKELKSFTAKQMHDDPTAVYQEAVKRPAIINHKHHGKLVITSMDKFLELTTKKDDE